MMIMSAYYGLMVHDDQKEEYQFSKGQVLTFNYSEPFSHTYLYRVVLDNHNTIFHGGGKNHQIGLYNAWIPTGGQSEYSPF